MTFYRLSHQQRKIVKIIRYQVSIKNLLWEKNYGKMLITRFWNYIQESQNY
jgi:hypothetical protein